MNAAHTCKVSEPRLPLFIQDRIYRAYVSWTVLIGAVLAGTQAVPCRETEEVCWTLSEKEEERRRLGRAASADTVPGLRTTIVCDIRREPP